MFDLLGCPFCGSRARLDTVGRGGSRRAAVFCDNALCHAVAPGVGANIHLQRASAIAAWNRRAPHPALARVEKLEGMLGECLPRCVEDTPHRCARLGGDEPNDPRLCCRARAALGPSS